MSAHQILSVVACVGHLAFALAVWTRRGQSRVAPLLALLFLDVFAWNFADLAYGLSGARTWPYVDRFFSGFMPALALHVVVRFVGRARQLRHLLIGAYVWLAAVAVTSGTAYWWRLLLASALAFMGVAIALLLLHRKHSVDAIERARTDLILGAVALGTLLSLTELVVGHLGTLAIPRLGNIGTLLSMALLAAASLRLNLLDAEVPISVLLYAVLAGVTMALGSLAAVKWLPADSAVWVLATACGMFVLLIGAREVRSSRRLSQERSQRLELLGRLSEQLAHDLRNPLAALKGSLQFLAVEHQEGRSLDAQVRFVTLMLEQVERVQQTVSDYQRLAKVEPRFVSGSLNQVVSRVVSLQRFGVPSGVVIRTELDPTLPSSELDPDLLTAALENLLSNAGDAMPRGGTIWVRTRALETQDSLLLSVEDDGIGMDARQLERATDELYTTKAHGSGLGLSFVQRVVSAHAGTFLLKSKVGGGTLVNLTIRRQIS